MPAPNSPLHVTVLAPHADDAALSIPVLLWGLAGTGARVTLVTCFTRSQWAPAAGGGSPEQVTALRRSEDAAYVRRLGTDARHVPLALLDAPLRRPGLSVFNYVGGLEEDIAALAQQLRGLAPARLVLAPLGFGGHIDHLVTQAAALDVFGLGALAFYEDVPYSLGVPPPAMRRHATAVSPAEGPPLQRVRTGWAFAPEVWKQAVDCYPSQFSPSERLRILEAAARRPAEYLWANARGARLLRALNRAVRT